jgi:hypothetical protein
MVREIPSDLSQVTLRSTSTCTLTLQYNSLLTPGNKYRLLKAYNSIFLGIFYGTFLWCVDSCSKQKKKNLVWNYQINRLFFFYFKTFQNMWCAQTFSEFKSQCTVQSFTFSLIRKLLNWTSILWYYYRAKYALVHIILFIHEINNSITGKSHMLN